MKERDKNKREMLLCDFHIHSQFSDGHHSLREVIDVYGAAGFDAISITDHLCESKTILGRAAHFLKKTLTRETFDTYINAIKYEAERAKKLYEMIVIPGVEITKNSFSHHDSAHILALGVDQFIDPNQSIPSLLKNIKDMGGVSVAAHPVSTRKIETQTYYLWDKKDLFKECFDAWEAASGPHWFEEVATSGLPLLANSDLHNLSQLKAWKTLVHSKKSSQCILESIKQQNLDFIFYQGANHRITKHHNYTRSQAAVC